MSEIEDRCCVFGSREFFSRMLVEEFVDSLPLDTVVISGMARGPDTWAYARAKARGMKVEKYEADWILHGKAAGFLRNTTLVERSTRGVAFWDGVSRGTLDTINKFHAAGKPVAVLTGKTSLEGPKVGWPSA